MDVRKWLIRGISRTGPGYSIVPICPFPDQGHGGCDVNDVGGNKGREMMGITSNPLILLSVQYGPWENDDCIGADSPPLRVYLRSRLL